MPSAWPGSMEMVWGTGRYFRETAWKSTGKAVLGWETGEADDVGHTWACVGKWPPGHPHKTFEFAKIDPVSLPGFPQTWLRAWFPLSKWWRMNAEERLLWDLFFLHMCSLRVPEDTRHQLCPIINRSRSRSRKEHGEQWDSTSVWIGGKWWQEATVLFQV